MMVSFARRHWLSWLFISMLVGLAVPALLGGMQAFTGVAAMSWRWLAILILLVFLAMNLNVLRFRMLLRRHAVGLGQWSGLQALLSVAFASNATPAGVGAPLTAMVMLRRHRVPASVTLAVLGVAAIMDAVVLLGLLVWAGTWVLTGAVGFASSWQFLLPILVLLAGLAGIWLAVRRHRPLVRWSGHILARLGVPEARRRRLAGMLVRVRRSFREILALPRGEFFVMLLICVAHRLIRYSIIYLAVIALGGDIDWVYGFLVQLLALGGARLFFLPGGAGGAEVFAAGLLASQIEAATAATVILVWRFFTFYLYLVLGLAALLHVAGGDASRLFRNAREAATRRDDDTAERDSG